MSKLKVSLLIILNLSMEKNTLDIQTFILILILNHYSVQIVILGTFMFSGGNKDIIMA